MTKKKENQIEGKKKVKEKKSRVEGTKERGRERKKFFFFFKSK